MGTHPIFESDFDCLTEMISRLILSCLRPCLLKQSIRSVNATVATSARGRGSNISKEEIETRRESRKASKEESSAEAPSSSGSPKWDSTPQNIWLSDSIPETALLKFKVNHGHYPWYLDFFFQKFDTENVLKQSKLHYTGTNFIFANPYHMDPMTSCHWQRYLNQATRPYKVNNSL